QYCRKTTDDPHDQAPSDICRKGRVFPVITVNLHFLHWRRYEWIVGTRKKIVLKTCAVLSRIDRNIGTHCTSCLTNCRRLTIYYTCQWNKAGDCDEHRQ